MSHSCFKIRLCMSLSGCGFNPSFLHAYIHTHTYIHTYIHTYMHAYIHILHGSISVSKTVGCGTSHEYTNIQIYSIKYDKYFTKTILYIIFAHKKSIFRVKGVCMYFLKAALYCALPFLRIVTLCGKLLKIFVPA